MSGGVCWCLLYLVLSLGVWRGVLVYLCYMQGCLGCFVMFCGISEGSAHVESSKAGANPPFWPNPEMQDFFTEHL